MKEVHLSKLIKTIYDAALETTKWQDTINLLTSTFDGRSSFLYTYDKRTQSTSDVFFSSDTDNDYLKKFDEYYINVNPYPIPIHDLAPTGIPLSDEMVMTRTEAHKTEYYNDWIKPQELGSSQVGLKLDIDQNRFIILGTHVNPKNYDKKLKTYFQSIEKIIPHINNALQVSNLVNTKTQQNTTVNSTLGHIGLPTFWLNKKFQLLNVNSKAEQILRCGGLVKLNKKTRCLEAEVPKSSVDLYKAFKKCLDEENNHLNNLFPLISAFDGSTHIAWAKLTKEKTIVLIIASKSEPNSLNIDLIKSLLGLTEAEAKLAIALANGVSLKHYSSHSGISYNTAKNQLSSIFEKTRLSSQAELTGYIWKVCRFTKKMLPNH